MGDIQEPVPGLEIERLHNGKIITVSSNSPDGSVIGVGFEILSEMLEAWADTDVPCLMLFDMSRVMLTPYVRRKATELAEIRPDVHGRTAIIISASTVGHLIRMFVSNSLSSNRERRVFFTYEDGIAWLEELL